MDPSQILKSTSIPIPSKIRNKRVNNSLLHTIFSNGTKSPNSTQNISSSLATVFMAKKNSFTVENMYYYNEDESFDQDHSFSQIQLSGNSPSISSSPESSFSELSSFDESFVCNSNLSSATSLSLASADECHPLFELQTGEKSDEEVLEDEDSDDSEVVEEAAMDTKFEFAKQKKGTLARPFVSNLTKSIRSLSINHKLILSMPQLLPEKSDGSVKIIQLKTFSVSNTPLDDWDLNDNLSQIEFNSNSEFTRSIRSNPLFLRLYAMENVAQEKKLIPNIFEISENNHHSKEEEAFQLLGEKAKLKLFNNIKLPPRQDLPKNNNLQTVRYMVDEENIAASAEKTCGKKHQPWVQFDHVCQDTKADKFKRKFYNDNFKSATRRTHGVVTGKYSCQYVVKGYVNPRWVPR